MQEGIVDTMYVRLSVWTASTINIYVTFIIIPAAVHHGHYGIKLQQTATEIGYRGTSILTLSDQIYSMFVKENPLNYLSNRAEFVHLCQK